MSTKDNAATLLCEEYRALGDSPSDQEKKRNVEHAALTFGFSSAEELLTKLGEEVERVRGMTIEVVDDTGEEEE